MKASIATVTLSSFSPYSQSHHHEEPKLEGESPEAHDLRTHMSKANLSPQGTLMIPCQGMHQAIMSAAKYSKRQIPGQGKATWTAKFTAGIAFLADIDTGIKKEDLQSVAIYVNSDGVRGSGKRVTRHFPIVPEWEATFDVLILDPIITKDVFTEMLELAGMYVGIGRFRPQNGGINGRFTIKSLTWADNRELVKKAA